MKSEDVKVGIRVVPSAIWTDFRRHEDIRGMLRQDGYLVIDMIENAKGINLISLKGVFDRYLAEDFELYEEKENIKMSEKRMVMQVKEFLNYQSGSEYKINEWLMENKNIRVCDIKYSVGCFQEDRQEFSGALIVYEVEIG